MARRWDLAALIDELKYKVAFNEGQTDQDFLGPTQDPDKRFRDAINEAYVDEIEEAAQTGDPRWFYTVQSMTWPASTQTLSIPEALRGKSWIALHDTTNADPGDPVWVSEWTEGSTVRWKDTDTLSWGTAGPSAERTLRVTYMAEPKEMLGDAEEPMLLPARFRHVLAWSAAIKLRRVADEQVPRGWIIERNDIRERMLKFFSARGPLQTGGPLIRNTEPDYYGLTY